MTRLGGIRESVHDARRALWHLRHEGPEGLRRFRMHAKSDVARTATLAEILACIPESRIRTEIDPMRVRVAGRFLRRQGLAVFARPGEEKESVARARSIASTMRMAAEPLDVYLVQPDGTVKGPRGCCSPTGLALVFKAYEGAVLGASKPFEDSMAICGTPVLASDALPAEGREGLERLGYMQRVRNCSGSGATSVSAVVATNRPVQLPHVIATLASQTRIPDEILVGTHGFAADAAVRASARDCGLEVAWVEMESAMSVGGVFRGLISRARGEWIAKMDDDDFYGCEYIADALWTGEKTGAALVGKNAAYTYLEDANETGLRFAGRELIDTYLVCGPTLFTRRDVALDIGYPDLRRSDDTGYVTAVREAGGRIVATARFGFVYMRHSGSHVWSDASAVSSKTRAVHAGMPDEREFPFGCGGFWLAETEGRR